MGGHKFRAALVILEKFCYKQNKQNTGSGSIVVFENGVVWVVGKCEKMRRKNQGGK